MTFAVKGGIGDFLQCLPFMLKNPDRKYLVASHYDRVPEFFNAIGLKVEEMPLGRLNGIELCPRELFFRRNPFQRQVPIFASDRPILGIHLGGSDYSISVEKRFGFPPKALPLTVLKNLIHANDKRSDIWVFGTTSEFDSLLPDWREFKSDHIRFITDDDVTVSLSKVSACSMFIGSDSAFKTMSAMLRIKTIVWVGDYKDEARDSRFIQPYIDAGIMSVFRYRDLNHDHEIKAGVNFCEEQMAAYA